MNQIFILGSCVTRDAFELTISQNYKIVNYLARTSLASSFYSVKASEEMDLSGVMSNFQKRMIINDLFKKTEDKILSTEFDWLLIDLIDERFDLYLTEDNSLFTLSSELLNQVNLSEKGEKIKSNTDAFFQYWCKGWDYLLSLAKKHRFIDKILVNKVYWTNDVFGGGKVFVDNYQNWIDQNNRWLDRLYDYIRLKGGVRFLTYPQDKFQADNQHKWGMQPYHYYEGFYAEFINQLNYLSDWPKKTIQLGHELVLVQLSVAQHNSNENTIAFEGNFDKDADIVLNLTLASGKSVAKKDLLYFVRYYPDIEKEKLLKLGYTLSPLKDIGYFKYIPTLAYSVYERSLEIYVPSGVEAVVIGIKGFYPKGKTVILEARAKLKGLDNE